MTSYWGFAFEAPIARYDFGRMAYTVVYLPPDVIGRSPFADGPRLRVRGEMAERPFEGAWQPVARDGSAYRQPTGEPAPSSHYLIVPAPLLREAGLAVGDVIELRFSAADPRAVELPEELAVALQDEHLAEAWNALTAGKKRAHAYAVMQAKRPETRSKRVEAVLAALQG